MQRAHAPPRQDAAGDAARQREQQALDQQVPDKLMPRGAHGQPHRDFFRARGAAHQQQRRQVAARDGEDEADDDEHQRGDRHERRVRLRVDRARPSRRTTVMPGPTANSPSVRNCSGYSAASRCASTSIAALACATVTPSRRRAFTRKGAKIVAASRGARSANIAGTAVIGSQKSVPRPMSTVPR